MNKLYEDFIEVTVLKQAMDIANSDNYTEAMAKFKKYILENNFDENVIGYISSKVIEILFRKNYSLKNDLELTNRELDAQHIKSIKQEKEMPKIKKAIFNDPATIVLWDDGTKTVVRCDRLDSFDPEKGIAMAVAKKAYGNTGKYNDILGRWVGISVDDDRTIAENDSIEEVFHKFSKQACNTVKKAELLCATYGEDVVNSACEAIQKLDREQNNYISKSDDEA